MPWNLFRHKQSAGSLPMVQQQQGSFPFQASAGHNYDLWPWVYPAQTNQYTYFNAFYGNQLPSFHTYVPRYQTAHPGAQLNRPWVTSTNKQVQTAMQSQVSGVGPLQMSQQTAADYIAKIGQQWSQGGGGPRRMTRPRQTGR